MGSFDRSKKRIQLWKKALFHFALCFVMGFFTGFAPTNTTASVFSRRVGSYRPTKNYGMIPTQPVKVLEKIADPGTVNRSLMSQTPTAIDRNASANLLPVEGLEPDAVGQLIIVTTTRSDDGLQEAFLRRLGYTLKLVPPPLLWIVVQARADAGETAEMLRQTGVMYRHLTVKENFTEPAAAAEQQRNVALSHIEYHRLTGIVHFAGVSNVYDLQFFEEIRKIKVLGSWPLAMVSTNSKRVVVDGPICNTSKVVGSLFKDLSNEKVSIGRLMSETDTKVKPPKINMSGFAFNSSILWDPERWGRATSVPDTSQDSMKFVQDVLLEDETKLKGVPADCSKIMLWQLYIPRLTPLLFHQIQRKGKK